MLASLKDGLAIIREALIIVAVLAVLLFPSQVGTWLFARGVQKIEVAGAEISLAQFNKTKELLNTVEDAASATGEQPSIQAALQKAAGQLSQTIATQVRALTQDNPSVLPRSGWIYLGSINDKKTDWRAGVLPTIREKWPPQPGDVVIIATDANLREDSASVARPRARIVSVLPGGTHVTIRELDDTRPIPATDKFAPGFRAWARVEVAS